LSNINNGQLKKILLLKYRAVINFLTLEGKSPKEIHERMMNVYRELCPAYATVKKWAKKYKHGRESLQDDSRSGIPSTTITEENVDAVLQLIMADKRVTIEKIAEVLGICIGVYHHPRRTRDE
jgi:transposase